MELVDKTTPQFSIFVITEDLDVTEQVELASQSNSTVNTRVELNSELYQDQSFIDSPVVVYDLDKRDLEIAKTDILSIKKSTPSKAIILVGDKETINTFINGDFEYLVFRVFAKPLRAKQMQLLLNSAFGTISDRASDIAINDTLSVIEQIENKNQTSFFKNYKIIAPAIILLLIPILYFLFFPAKEEELSIRSRPQLTDTSQPSEQSQPLPSSTLEADGSLSSNESLLIVGSLESDPNPLDEAEEEALLAELEAAKRRSSARQETNRPSTSRTTASSPVTRNPPPRPVARNTSPAPAARNTSRANTTTIAETPSRVETAVNEQAVQQASNQQTSSSPNEIESLDQEEQSVASLVSETQPVVSPPVLISKINPRYPRTAFSRGIEGWVDINIQINDEGDVTDVEIVDSEPGRLFVRAVRSAVEDWKYSPALNTVTQTPVESVVQELRISFKIEN